MAIRVALNHKTVYKYDRLVSLSPQIIRLRPAPHCRTPVLSYSLKIEPKNHFLNWQQDPQANYLARAVFPEKVNYFSVEVDLVADMTVINPFDFFLEPQAEKFPFQYDSWLTQELAPFLRTEPVGDHLRAYLSSIDATTPTPTVNFLVNLNARLQQEIGYLIRMEPGVQAPDYTLEHRSGSCRDSAWLLVQILRNLGLAARFVSGYLIQLKPDVKALDGPVGAAEDFTDLHAWCEVYLPGAGWIGLDPTSGLLAGEGHLPVAASPEPASSAPVTGGVDPCQVEFEHAMSITRVQEDPRVTKPYSDAQWSAIEALGRAIDHDLDAHDVRLTMGGEPTFVGAEDVDAPEWNGAALGPAKRKLAGDLISRLRARQKPGSLLHFGQGKWYPGEPLPRWALTCYWRKDGHPIWRDMQWLADDQHTYEYTSAEAGVFAKTLAERLSLSPDFVSPAYEDPITYIDKEGKLPINVSPLDSKLDTPEDRERLRRVFQRGLNEPTGFVLPIAPARHDGPKWQSGMWMLRGQHLFLLAGDSPVGLRLPLKSLPYSPNEEPPFPVDPFAPRRALPWTNAAPAAPAQTRFTVTASDTNTSQVVSEQSASGKDDVVRTALCVEARDGRMCLFMPPLPKLEDYLELLRSIEDTAASLKIPVIIEGYTPPHDPRVESIKVTPDPGVIEINVPPVRTWGEAVANTTALYEDAHHSRLRAEKFMIDGRHTGTGGGNHIVLGAANPADSPILRRPDLLKSCVAYWNNHPSLSYLFSGLFIGPTSQAPRVDETRKDALYELAIAFEQVPDRHAGEVPPWQVDRIFRNLLVDVTGNTHRAEFCIDKLYSPDSSTGRLGLLELRAFEMPPHAQMSLAQQLLLRALIARFWKDPYEEPLVHWGTRLHDRFMLPHYIEQDFHAVLDDLRTAGYRFDNSWYAPFTEFRYPVYGRVNYDGVEIELRQATEPWYVLGEEPAGGGTARYVDSSVERLQVKVSGLTSERYMVTCNGRRVPLANTGTRGEYVAGVRYRAWQPPSCLHPLIPVQSPLVMDLVDAWSQRSIGGCTYHVAHPAGRNYETFPVNSYEAEARRLARFQGFGHTPGPLAELPPEERNPEFPCTLDLRRGGSRPKR